MTANHKPHIVGNDILEWVGGCTFKERQPKLSVRRGDPTAHVRMDSVNKKIICAYYNLWEKTLEKYKLSDSPAQIYNMDETGMPLNPRPPKYCG